MYGRYLDQDKLRRLIASRGLTVRDFCAAAEISKSSYYAALTPPSSPHHRELSLLRATKVATVLGCDIDDFTIKDSSSSAYQSLEPTG